MAVEAQEFLLQKVRIVADFELLSMNDAETAPLDGEAWMTDVLEQAKGRGLIEDYRVTAVHEGGPFGLQFIQFYVDAMQAIDDGVYAKTLGEKLLCDYIFMDKVEVRWVTLVGEA